jgi:hypothetical protein
MRIVSALYRALKAFKQVRDPYAGRHRGGGVKETPAQGTRERVFEAGAWYHLRTPEQRVIPAWSEPEPLWLAQLRDAQWAAAVRRMANRHSVALALQ